jgi:hypothetical protein
VAPRRPGKHAAVPEVGAHGTQAHHAGDTTRAAVVDTAPRAAVDKPPTNKAGTAPPRPTRTVAARATARRERAAAPAAICSGVVRARGRAQGMQRAGRLAPPTAGGIPISTEGALNTASNFREGPDTEPAPTRASRTRGPLLVAEPLSWTLCRASFSRSRCINACPSGHRPISRPILTASGG